MKRNVEKWIYRELTGKDKEIFGKIEEALGFKLFVWQKSFLLTGQFRRMGATTAKCLRGLLFTGMEPLDFYRYPANKRERTEMEEIRKIKEKLDAAGIKTRPIFWNESDRERYYRERGVPGKCESPDCKNCPFPPCEKGERRL